MNTVKKPEDIAKFIDHTALKATTTEKDIEILCKEAVDHRFATVCVNPFYVSLAKKLTLGSDVKVCTVIGFPLGANTKETKANEAIKAVADGANEVDMVLNIGALKNGNLKYVEDDIKLVVESIPSEIRVKVILETCYLSKEEIKIASELSLKAGADFVKTSTGFGTGGATVEDIRIMKEVVGTKMEIKASGGVKDCATAMEMIEAGASRIGTSSGVAIVSGKSGKSTY